MAAESSVKLWGIWESFYSFSPDDSLCEVVWRHFKEFFFSFLIGVVFNYSQDQDKIVLGVYSHVIIIRCSEAL